MNDWIFFDTSLRPQIESGEYAVLTGNGRPVRIICWDAKDRLDRPIVGLVTESDGRETLMAWNIHGAYGNERSDIHLEPVRRESITCNGWVCRDRCDNLWYAAVKPHKTMHDDWSHILFPIDNREFPQVRWTDEQPTRAKLTITITNQ